MKILDWREGKTIFQIKIKSKKTQKNYKQILKRVKQAANFLIFEFNPSTAILVFVIV